MRKVLPLAVVLLLAASACERVEDGESAVPGPPPRVVDQGPSGEAPVLPPEGDGEAQVVPPEDEQPADAEPPDGETPEEPPAPSARDLLLLDMEVAIRNIAGARTDLGNQQIGPAKTKVESARRSIVFLEASVPSARALELLQRALVQMGQEQNEAAGATVQRMASVIPQMGSLPNAEEVNGLVTAAATALSEDDSQAAREALESLQPLIRGGEQEDLLVRLNEYLRGARNAIYRDAISVALVELDEANKHLIQLRSLTEAAWPAAASA